MSGGIVDDAIVRGVRELSARYRLGASAGDQLVRLLECVAGDPLAPTTVRSPAAILDDHLADSLVALDLPDVRAARILADLGAGAGFPGLPLAIALPSVSLSLVESAARKCAFIARAIAATGIANAAAVCARAEAWSDGLGRCDVVTARALAPLAVVAEYAAPLLTVGGVLVAWLGRIDPDAERPAHGAAAELGLELDPPVAVTPYPGAQHRHLRVARKVSETPARFPRRPGMARKRPLGA